MKIKRKGKKVHPSPPQTAAATLNSAAQDSLSVLNLLPASILTLLVALSVQDREILAYMITRSLKTTTTGSSNSSSPSNQKESKSKKRYSFHKPPVFDCECFDCYTSFWFRWDSSPNREVIHQAIEAVEEHLASGELEMKRSSNNRRGKKKEKEKVSASSPTAENETLKLPVEETVQEMVDERQVEMEDEESAAAVVAVRGGTTAAGGHKGFARKVLPDVLGVFNSRLWNLWGPDV